MKYRAYFDENDIIIICTECNTKHKLTFFTFGQYFLENEPFAKIDPVNDDKFELDGDLLYPIFICRNYKCRNAVIVHIKKNDLDGDII